MNNVLINKINIEKIKLNGLKINVPSSKSYLNRALVVSSLQNYPILLKDVYEICDDVDDMILSLKKIGIKIDISEQGEHGENIVVHGKNGIFLKPDDNFINCGLGGTTTRFLLGLSSLFNFDVIITAEKKMLERPIGEMLVFLKTIGKKIEFLSKENHLPIKITGKAKKISEIEVNGSNSSQFLSSILMVSKQLDIKKIDVNNLVSKSYINITLDVLKKNGVIFDKIKKNDKITYIRGNQEKKALKSIKIEKDWSSASYFLALKYLFNIKNDILNMSKTTSQGDVNFIKIIKKIDDYKCKNDFTKSLILNMKNMPDVSMTAMIICCLQGWNTKITGLKTLKYKECDRLTAMQNEFKKIGITTEISKDFNSITIYGKKDLKLTKRVSIETYNDHRIAMCFAILGTKIGNIEIKNAKVVEKSFKNFWQELNRFNCVDFKI